MTVWKNKWMVMGWRSGIDHFDSEDGKLNTQNWALYLGSISICNVSIEPKVILSTADGN